MISYLGKYAIKDNHFMRVFFFGAVVSIPITKEEFDSIELKVLDRLNITDFDINCYNKGNDCITRLSLNRKGA